ncbi:MAG: FecR family protein [Rectinemataceae bacterium]|jgi:hypothetical protein
MKRIFFGLLILLLLPALSAAQGKTAVTAGQKLVLEFVDGPDLSVTAADKSVKKLNHGIVEGDSVPVGSTIVTGPGTSAELKLRPNGTIIKLAKATSFTVAGLASTPQEKNAFALVAGKIRAVAAKGAQYQISSQTAVCAVRGTDFSFLVDEGAKAVLMVAKGLVQFDKTDTAGAVLGSIPVAAGEAADAFAGVFASFKFTPSQFAEQFGDVNFKKLRESDVPGEAAAPGKVTPAQAAEKLAPDQAAVESGFVKWLRENLGFEIGSVMIDDVTYSKAVLQPNLTLGKAKLGLYLPIIYTSNMFDPNDWYKPGGNNEWSFGSSQFRSGDYVGGAQDLAIDLALKIKYFEYGTQLKDPFFIKVGNLEDMTLGHGLIMRNYANDTDFPSVRRLGFETGLDTRGGGFELVANDLTDPNAEIFGGRLFVRPIPGFKLAFGVSAVVDWAPASVSPGLLLGNSDDALKLIDTGVDIDLPIIQSSVFGLRLFADGATIIPYTTEQIGATAPGLQYQLFYDSSTGTFNNWGAAGGLIGNVLFLDWRLEYRYFTGNFVPSLFDGTYDRMRGQYAVQYDNYLLSGTSSSAPDIMGIYGEGGFKLFNKKLDLDVGYFWPWSPDASVSTQLLQSSDDLHVKLVIKKGLIPVYDVAGAIFYDRRGLASAIANNNFSLLDGNSVFGGELDIPVPKTPNLDLAIIFQTMPVLDSSGNFVYANPANALAGIPELKPSISIETRFHF